MAAVQQAFAESTAQNRVRQEIDRACEKGILGIVVLTVLWGPLAFGGLPPASFLVIQGLIVLALVLWLVRIWASPAHHLLWPPVCWAVVAFVIYTAARWRTSPIEYAARQEFIQVLVYASLFFVVINNLTRRDAPTVIAVCLIGLGMLLSLDAIFQFATKYPRIWGFPRRLQFIDRGVGTYINPDHLAGFLGMTVPLAISYTLVSRFSPTIKVLFAYAGLVMFAGIAVTLSRGGIVSTGAMLAVFCVVLVFQRGYWLPALGILVGLIAFGFAYGVGFDAVQKRFESTLYEGKVADTRPEYWTAAIHLFEDSPVWGIGPGHFDSAFARHRPRVVQIRPVYAHNDYLNTLSDYGAVGLAIVLAALGLMFYGAWRTWPALNPPQPDLKPVLRSNNSAFLLGACMGLVDILIHSTVDFNMHIPANAIVAVVFMALISSQWRFASERLWFTPRSIWKIVLTIALIPVAGWLTGQEIVHAREVYWQHQVDNESISTDARVEALKNACAAEPSNYANSYNLGEYYRLASFEGNPGYEKDAREALKWYDKSMVSNPLDAYVPMRYGMCLDWLGETNSASRYFELAVKMDPNNQHVAYFMGRHYVELGDYALAVTWFERSISIQWSEMAAVALRNLKERMADPSGLYKK